MLIGERDIVIGNKINEKVIVEGTYKIFKDNWKVSSSYKKKRSDEMISKKLDTSILGNKYMNYVKTLYCMLEEYSFKHISKEIGEELIYWESKGGMCIHLSVLLYKLLEIQNSVSASHLKFYQGFYWFELRCDFPSFIGFSKNQIGMHSWLTYKGSLIDITSNQNKTVFDFKGEDFVLGKIPQGYLLKGFDETSLVNEYAKMFAQKGNYESVEEWLTAHMGQYKKLLEEILF
ncbi:hypothetical protein [Viridibacillus arvi]|uniref:hypothetical protein n=1 Tax=Viridibacillus arvi TaxID=263475 RepID=UPI0034CD2833